MRFVSLSTDAAPTYAAYLPVAVWLWSEFGYRAIVHIHDGNWDSDFGRLVLHETCVAGAYVVRIPVVPPLSVANTMRVSRLAAASVAAVHPDDFVLTSDVDMLPLHGAFFDRHGPMVVLRALYTAWLEGDGACPVVTEELLSPVRFRFPMCYTGAVCAVWRELLPLAVGDSERSVQEIVRRDANGDPNDIDERTISRVFLSSPRVAGPVCFEDSDGCRIWHKGEMTLVDPIYWPNLTSYPNMPRGLLRLGENWKPGLGPRPAAVDFIPSRFVPGTFPWWCLDVVSEFVPSQRDRVRSYRNRLDKLLSVGGGVLWAS